MKRASAVIIRYMLKIKNRNKFVYFEMSVSLGFKVLTNHIIHFILYIIFYFDYNNRIYYQNYIFRIKIYLLPG